MNDQSKNQSLKGVTIPEGWEYEVDGFGKGFDTISTR